MLQPAPKFHPTPEQEAILRAFLFTSDSIMIEAMAGCSKTSTVEILVRSQRPKVPTGYIVFNKKNKEEAEAKFKSSSGPWAHLGSASHVNVLTANGLGHGAWSKAIGKRLTLNPKKLSDILKQILKSEKEKDFGPDAFSATLALARRARTIGLIPQGIAREGLVEASSESWEELSADLWLQECDERCTYYAERTLTESIRRSYLGEIDFDDQIYMSALFGGIFPRYPDLFGDEVQDYSPLNQRQVALTASNRIILVGDSRQAIYAFRGADSASMSSLRQLRNNWLTFPLSVTFRCPKAIVERQQAHAKGFQAAASNQEGIFEDWQGKESWSVKDLPTDCKIAILCRNNAPLLAAAIRCIKAGRGATVLGSEIGKGLILLLKKVCPNETTSSQAQAIVRSWSQAESSKHLANEEDAKAALVLDKAECLMAVLSETPNTSAALSLLADLFSAENCKITCSTGHKAKGLEWPLVIHLDPWRIPSSYARKQLAAGNPTAFEQDMNLKYVIETRAQERLILANSENML